MNFRDQDRLLVVAILLMCLAALYFTGLSLLALLASRGTTFKDFDAAAWTQAVGSVGALAGIWYSIDKQRQMALDAEQRAKLDAAREAATDATTAVATISAELELMHTQPAQVKSFRNRLHRSRLQEGLLLAQAVRVTDLPIEKRAATIALRQVANAVIDCIDAGAAATDPEDVATANRILAAIVLDQMVKVHEFEKVLSKP